MRPPIPVPRLLPVTIAMLAMVLAAKAVGLALLAATNIEPAALIAAAWASGHEASPPDATHGAPAEHGKPARPEQKPSAADPRKADERPPVPDGPPPVSETEKAMLLDLRERRRELEAREMALSARESMLSAAEQKLSSRVDELRALQTKLESLDASHRQQEDAAWQGLVKVYETMKPRDAAAIFNDLAMPVLLPVIGRMKEAKAAAILATMTTDKARDVTTQLASARSKSATEAGDKPPQFPGPASAPGAGG